MTKRKIAAMLWFYAGLYVGSFLTGMFGVSPLLGPIIGAAAAGLIIGLPNRNIWTVRPGKATVEPEGVPEPA